MINLLIFSVVIILIGVMVAIALHEDKTQDKRDLIVQEREAIAQGRDAFHNLMKDTK